MVASASSLSCDLRYSRQTLAVEAGNFPRTFMPSSLNSFWGRRASQDSTRPRSTASTAPSLPPYTVEPFLLSPLIDCPGSPDTLVPTNLSTNAIRGEKERVLEHGLQAGPYESDSDLVRPAAVQGRPSDEATAQTPTSDLRATPSTLDLNSNEQVRNETVDRPTMISEALQAGESIYALHHQTVFDPKGTKNDNATHARLQAVYLGELVYKVKHYFSLVRRSRSIGERVQRNLIDRALQLCSKLKAKQIAIPAFWTSMITLVNETQRILSNRHLDLGVGELAASLSEIERSLAIKKSRQNLRPSNAPNSGPYGPEPGPSGTSTASIIASESSSGRTSERRPSRDQSDTWSDPQWIYLFG